MTESIQPTQENQSSISLGQQLKQAREALTLSIEDVSKETNLKKSHIESLENDIFILQNVAPTFVRGYVRNYVRFLRLPENLVTTVNYGEVTIPKNVVNHSTTNVTPKSQGKWVKYLTVLVLLGAVGMTLLWWWQDYQKEQENRDQFVSTSTASTQNEVNLPALQAPQTTEQAPVVAPATNDTSVQPVTSAQLEVAAPAQPAVETAAPATEAAAPAEPVNVLQQTAPADQAATAEQQPAATDNSELRIEISGKESWITVKGAKSKKSLAEKLYTNGEVLTFDGNEQYRLTIGAPANVKIFYKGQQVPLKIDGRVARIKLPLAQ